MEKIDELDDAETLDREYDTSDLYPAKIKISRDQFSLFQLKRKLERGEIIIDPDFQRLFVWNNKQKSELIESILMGIPLPVLYFFEQKNGSLQVVDGRQRLTACFEYMNDEFSLADLKILQNESGKSFQKLETLMQSKIEDFQMTIYRIQPPTPDKVKFDIFDRVNRGGTKLNHQEMRNALHQGKSTILLKQLAESDEFKKATGYAIKSKRMKDTYIILRFLSFYVYFQKWECVKDVEYKSDVNDFLAKMMDLINEMSDDEITTLRKSFLFSMDNCFNVLGDDCFRFSKGSKENKLPINMALFEVLTYFFSDPQIDYIDKKDEIRSRIDEQKEHFLESKFSNPVDSSTQVNDRFMTIIKLQESLK